MTSTSRLVATGLQALLLEDGGPRHAPPQAATMARRLFSARATTCQRVSYRELEGHDCISGDTSSCRGAIGEISGCDQSPPSRPGPTSPTAPFGGSAPTPPSGTLDATKKRVARTGRRISLNIVARHADPRAGGRPAVFMAGDRTGASKMAARCGNYSAPSSSRASS